MKLYTLISQYVAQRKSLGAQFRNSEYLLKAFCRAMGNDIDVADVQVEPTRVFLAGSGPLTLTWHTKHVALRGFYHYAISRGYVTHSPLPTIVPKQPPHFVPYIYTHDELRRLFAAVYTFQKKHSLIVPKIIQALLLMLYGTGLRLNEALSLTMANVDLAQAVITIRETKFYKTRLVPMGPQLAHAMRKYVAWCGRERYSLRSDAPFFKTRHGEALNKDTVEGVFERIRTKAGIKRMDGARYQPRLHDLRHTFAVHRLTAGYHERTNVQRLLEQLSVYLGHVCIMSTSRYLTMTPELLNEANARFERYALKGGTR